MKAKKIVDDATLIKALKALVPKMPATAKDLGAGRGHAAHIKALESKGLIYCDGDYLWRPTVKGEARLRE